MVGPKGIRDALLLNKGDGRFEDASASFGLPQTTPAWASPRPTSMPIATSIVFLTGVGDNRLLRNRDGKTFEDISSTLKPSGPPALRSWPAGSTSTRMAISTSTSSTTARPSHADKAFLDSGEPPPGLANTVFRNDGQPDPSSGRNAPGPDAGGHGIRRAHGQEGLALALDTLDRDHVAPRGRPRLTQGRSARHRQRPRPRLGPDRRQGCAGRLLNDRLGQFHEVAIEGSDDSPNRFRESWRPTSTRTAAPTWSPPAQRASPGLAQHHREHQRRSRLRPTFEAWPINAANWRAAQAVDLDLDGLPDLLGLPAASNKPGDLVLPAWARNEGNRSRPRPCRWASKPGLDGLIAVDLIGDPLPDILVIRPGEPPRWPETSATDSTGWPFGLAATGASSPS